MIKPAFIYAYDPLCGWCYGFHPVLERLIDRFDNRLSFEIVSGGLAVGENAETINEGYSYIRDDLKQVEKITGITFGENFKMLAEEGSYMYDSMPPCLALTAIKELAPESAIGFSIAMQKALFAEGKDLNDLNTYESILDEFSVAYDSFSDLFQSKETRIKTEQEFQWCKNMGATGFPTIFIRLDNEYGIVTKGYRPYEAIESHLHHLLNNIEKMLGQS